MGSKSDLPTMTKSSEVLRELEISHEIKIISAHRTTKLMYEFAENAEKRKIQVIIAGAGGAAHLPGMVASITNLPVIGVPLPGGMMDGLDSLLSTVQMPKGVPVATMSVGKSGAINSAIFCAEILSLNNLKIEKKLLRFKENGSNLSGL